MNKNAYGTGIIGFLTGLATGALIGVLYAPKSGEETREYLLEKGNDAISDVKESIESATGAIQDKALALKDRFESEVDKREREIEILNDKIKQLQAELKDSKPTKRSTSSR